MSFQLIRAHIESRVNDAFQAMVPPLEVDVRQRAGDPTCAALCHLRDLLHRHHAACGLSRPKAWSRTSEGTCSCRFMPMDAG